MRNNVKTLVMLSCMTISGAVLADTAESLAKIEAETAVLKAEAKKVEVQAQIASKQAEIMHLTAPPPTLTTQAGTTYISGPMEPTVLSVEGIGKTRYATLNLGNGITMDVKVGDTLPNGLRVLSIGANEVTVGDKKRRMRLAYGSQQLGSQPLSSYSGSANASPLPLPAPGTGFGGRGAGQR
jgi:type IV pilus biogenesis protein PilP